MFKLGDLVAVHSGVGYKGTIVGLHDDNLWIVEDIDTKKQYIFHSCQLRPITNEGKILMGYALIDYLEKKCNLLQEIVEHQEKHIKTLEGMLEILKKELKI